jgi:hypothetical protein
MLKRTHVPPIASTEHRDAVNRITAFMDSLPDERQVELAELVERTAATRRAGGDWRGQLNTEMARFMTGAA